MGNLKCITFTLHQYFNTNVAVVVFTVKIFLYFNGDLVFDKYSLDLIVQADMQKIIFTYFTQLPHDFYLCLFAVHTENRLISAAEPLVKNTLQNKKKTEISAQLTLRAVIRPTTLYYHK